MVNVVRPRKYQAPPPPGKIGVKETRELLGVSKQTLYRYAKEPDFPVKTLERGFTWFDKEAVERWKKDHTDPKKTENPGPSQ